MPGQIAYKETRRIVLQGVDGVVFVADSGPERVQSNLESMMDLEGNLRHHGLEPGRIPLVIQFNKRDLKSARSVQSLNSDLNPLGVPIVEAVAAQGRGVTEALEAITDIVSARIRDSLSGRRSGLTLTALDAREAPDDESLVNRYIKEIDQVRPQEEA